VDQYAKQALTARYGQLLAAAAKEGKQSRANQRFSQAATVDEASAE
jgi:hypothetical protein